MTVSQAADHSGAISLVGWTQLTEDFQELARFWVSKERSFVLVAPDHVNSATLLGSLLVECVHTAADGYAAAWNRPRPQVLAELWRGFDEERMRLEGQDRE